ncbi:MAG: cupin [Acaryochloris sp. RU_4_1]|nr:cupin [Acaryochloris sp. SU_5_25]NJM68596.1 cupin [Acaryochloris sp. RU_4_1]NJN39546.1 cupin [Acaryochloridaceae cyanobacterium CSU_3_4]NJR53682.1 cupin [Acaryochloris sp. CRU_2_0]
MTGHNYWVGTGGQCVAWEDNPENVARTQPYRLYRFLSDLDDILEQELDDQRRLALICPLVRRLLNSSTWLLDHYLPPDPDTGWSVLMLYDEPDYPITVQTVVWTPGSVSPIHNHAAWGIVALLSGQEKNMFWQRSGVADRPDCIEPVGDRTLSPGDILCLMPDTIHHIEACSDQPIISFNLYGETNYTQRFQFDPVQGTAQLF